PDTPANAKAKLGPVYEYYHTIREEIGGNAGAYGGYYLIRRPFDSGCISWGFQTVAWSGGQWDKRACLRQLAETEFGNAADVDVPERTDFGQWKPGEVINPKPQPGPTRARPSSPPGPWCPTWRSTDARPRKHRRHPFACAASVRGLPRLRHRADAHRGHRDRCRGVRPPLRVLRPGGMPGRQLRRDHGGGREWAVSIRRTRIS